MLLGTSGLWTSGRLEGFSQSWRKASPAHPQMLRHAYKVIPAMESAVMQSGYGPLAGSMPTHFTTQGSR